MREPKSLSIEEARELCNRACVPIKKAAHQVYLYVDEQLVEAALGLHAVVYEFDFRRSTCLTPPPKQEPSLLRRLLDKISLRDLLNVILVLFLRVDHRLVSFKTEENDRPSKTEKELRDEYLTIGAP